MKLNAKVGIATAIGAIAMTGPAVAQACNNGQGNQVRDQQGAQFSRDHGAWSRGDQGQFGRFGRRGRGFGRSAFGTLVSWNATQTGTNNYSGSITVSTPDFQANRGAVAHWSSGSNTQSTPQSPQVTYKFTNAKVFFGEGANPPAAGDLVKVIGGWLGHCQSTGTGTSTSTGTVRAIFIAVPRGSSPS
jgi:hypothetical protein